MNGKYIPSCGINTNRVQSADQKFLELHNSVPIFLKISGGAPQTPISLVFS